MKVIHGNFSRWEFRRANIEKISLLQIYQINIKLNKLGILLSSNIDYVLDITWNIYENLLDKNIKI